MNKTHVMLNSIFFSLSFLFAVTLQCLWDPVPEEEEARAWPRPQAAPAAATAA